jgi:hypothetical protein
MQIITFVFLLIMGSVAVSQPVADTEFVGTLQLPDDVIISYKLKFAEKDNGVIEGTSITDFYGADKTVSRIKGNYNASRDRISFIETENISTKSKEDESTFCYIHLSNAKVKRVGCKTIIQGAFKGRLKNGDRCIDGYLYLVGVTFLDELANKISNSDKLRNNDTIKTLLNKYNDVVKKDAATELKHKDKLELAWSGDDIIIEVWDGQEEDGDEISVMVNGKIILERFGITQQKKSIVVPVLEKITYLKFFATAVGSRPPCTVNIQIRGDNNQQNLRTVLLKGEFAELKVIKR